MMPLTHHARCTFSFDLTLAIKLSNMAITILKLLLLRWGTGPGGAACLQAAFALELSWNHPRGLAASRFRMRG